MLRSCWCYFVTLAKNQTFKSPNCWLQQHGVSMPAAKSDSGTARHIIASLNWLVKYHDNS